MAELVITHAQGGTTRHTLGDAPEVIGRDASCDLPLDDPAASRRHVRVTRTPHGYQVEDLGSKNGTLVNDETCRTRLLKHGDQIVIGATVVQFREHEGRSAPSVTISDDLSSSRATHYVSRERELNLSRQRLKMIYELGERLTTLQGQDQLLQSAMSICFETLHFERGAIGVRRPHSRLLDWPVVRNLQGAHGELTVSRTLLSRALEYGERAIYTEGQEGGGDPTVSMVQHGIRSAMCVPIVHHEETLGIIYGDRLRSSMSYTSEDIDFLAGIAHQVSIGLVNARLVEEQQRMIRLNHDIDMARQIQTGLFPARLPNRPGLRIAALNDPGQRVSGDYYDVIELPDGRVWCLVADVTGEGLAAALLMANLQAAVRVTIEETDDPGVLLARWNGLVCRNTEASKFITCLLMLLDPKRHEVRVAAAGHFAPLLLRGGEGPRDVEMDAGMPLGVCEDGAYPTVDVELGPAPYSLFCYTDGIVEAMNGDRHQFGHDRLVTALQDAGPAPPLSLVKQVRKQVAQHVGNAAQSDDITLLAVAVE